ncbi:MAG: MBL fold metallo-hydrolase [Candidatus Bathyarchaeia archaeon]
MVKVVDGIHSVDLSDAGIHSLECWILNCPEGTILIDTGMGKGSLKRIEAELRSMGKDWRDINLILVTHRHGDHIDNLVKIQDISNASVMAHEGDVREIEEATGVDVVPLNDGQILEYCGGIRVIHVPGHTKGNSCYHLPHHSLMIAGDTMFRDQMGRLSPPPERYCMDVQLATEKIARLLDYEFEKLLITHGRAETEDAKSAVRARGAYNTVDDRALFH